MKDLEFLEGFEKRMQILAAIDSIVNRSNRTMDIENLFERAHLDNIIFSVLVFIMERTLSEDEECTAYSGSDRPVIPVSTDHPFRISPTSIS